VLEGSTSQCPHCMGSGLIRSTESVALAVLRGLEDSLMSGNPRHLRATTPIDTALYLLNDKRAYLRDIESRYGITIQIDADSAMQGANYRIDTMAGGPAIVEPAKPRHVVQLETAYVEDDEPYEGGVIEIVEASDDAEEGATGDNGDRKRGRRRRRGGRKGEGSDGPIQANGEHNGAGDGRDRNGNRSRHESGEVEPAQMAAGEPVADNDAGPAGPDDADAGERDEQEGVPGSTDTAGAEGDSERRGRRRGRRGGRRNRRSDRPAIGAEGSNDNSAEGQVAPDVPGAEQPVVTDSAWDRDVPQQRRPRRHDEVRQADSGQQASSGDVAESTHQSEPVIAHRHLEAAIAVGSTYQQERVPESVHALVAAPALAASAEPEPAPAAHMAAAEPAGSSSELAGAPKRGWWMKRLTGL